MGRKGFSRSIWQLTSGAPGEEALEVRPALAIDYDLPFFIPGDVPADHALVGQEPDLDEDARHGQAGVV